MSDKLQQAIAAIKSGDKETGKQLLIEVLKVNRRNEVAWLWMTNVVNSEDERVKCLQNVLKINPDNEKAKRGLVILQQKQTRPPSQVDTPKTEIQPQPLKPLSAPEPYHVEEGTKQCPYCAETIKAEAKICRFCGRNLSTGQQASPTATSQSQTPIIIQSPPQRLWSPGVATVLSLVIPGAGQMYKGQVGKGILHLIVVVIGYLLFIIPGLILHILCVIDASRGNPYKDSETGQQVKPAQTVKESVEQTSQTNSNLPLIITAIIVIGIVILGCCKLASLGESPQQENLQKDVKQEAIPPPISTSPITIDSYGIKIGTTADEVLAIRGKAIRTVTTGQDSQGVIVEWVYPDVIYTMKRWEINGVTAYRVQEIAFPKKALPTSTATRVVPVTYTPTPQEDISTPIPPTIKLPTLPPVSSGGGNSGSGCCKHCGSNSKACGDSCISLNKTCNKGPGCACD